MVGRPIPFLVYLKIVFVCGTPATIIVLHNQIIDEQNGMPPPQIAAPIQR